MNYKVEKFDLERDYKRLLKGGGYVFKDDNGYNAAAITVEDVNFIALLRFYEGVAKGNHYHKKKTETILIISGVVECCMRSTTRPDGLEKIVLYPGDAITIYPQTAHVFYAKELALGLEWSSQAFDPEDIFTFEVKA